MGFALGSSMAKVDWIQSYVSRKGCGITAEPGQVYTQPGRSQRWQQGTPACGFKDLGRAGDGDPHL